MDLGRKEFIEKCVGRLFGLTGALLFWPDWLVVALDIDKAFPEEKCEGCHALATQFDCEGIALCDACWKDLCKSERSDHESYWLHP